MKSAIRARLLMRTAGRFAGLVYSGPPPFLRRFRTFFALRRALVACAHPERKKRPPERSCPRGAEDNLLIRERLDATGMLRWREHTRGRQVFRSVLSTSMSTKALRGPQNEWLACPSSPCRPIHCGSINLAIHHSVGRGLPLAFPCPLARVANHLTHVGGRIGISPTRVKGGFRGREKPHSARENTVFPALFRPSAGTHDSVPQDHFF